MRKRPRLSDIQSPSIYKSYILNWPINKLYLSYDVAVIQWITSCHKNRDHTCNNTLARIRDVIDNVRANAFSSLNNVHFEGDKIAIQQRI